MCKTFAGRAKRDSAISLCDTSAVPEVDSLHSGTKFSVLGEFEIAVALRKSDSKIEFTRSFVMGHEIAAMFRAFNTPPTCDEHGDQCVPKREWNASLLRLLTTKLLFVRSAFCGRPHRSSAR